MFTIKPRTRIQEGASWEDIQDGDCYETGYEISNSDGEIIYDFAGEDTKNWYKGLNKKIKRESSEILITSSKIKSLKD